MGLIIQTQRRAIEELFCYNGQARMELNDKQIFTTYGDRLYLLGISQGLGSCYDVWGANVAVLVKQIPIQQRFIKTKTGGVTRAVLLHKNSVLKHLIKNQNSLPRSFLCVELLHLKTANSKSVIFSLTGRKAFYVPL